MTFTHVFSANRFRRCRWLVTACVLVAGPTALPATDYYLGSAAGGQPGVAVASIAALNALSLRPGDRVLFQGGERFHGRLVISFADAGTPQNPVTFSSFGQGRATLMPGNDVGIYIHNASGIEIRDIDVQGPGAATSTTSGVEAVVAFGGTVQAEHLRLKNMRISGFRIGVELSGWNQGVAGAHPGWRDVRLEGLEVVNNRSEGIVTWGAWQEGQAPGRYSHSNVIITDCLVAENRGDPAATSHTGSGIVLGQVDGAHIEYCVARDNGGVGPNTGGGPFGIWVWDSRSVTIQHNIVYNQKSSTPVDGGAFDLDGGARDCVVQYNYSYHNEGPAIGLIQFEGGADVANNVIRYNISQDDARKAAGQGVFYVGDWDGAGAIEKAEVYGNTFFVRPNATGGRPPLVMIEGTGQIRGIRLHNNLFLAAHSGALLAGARHQPGRALYQGNGYDGGDFDLADFRRRGQELLNGSPTGVRTDARLRAPGEGELLREPKNLTQLAAYRRRDDSPLHNAGVDLRALGVDAGSRDFFGHPLSTSVWPIGADARVSAPPTNEDPGNDENAGTREGRLVNLAARARSGTGDDRLIVGWSTEGTTDLLVRGVGPALGALGVNGFLADPRLLVYDHTSTEIANNNDWGNSPGRADIVNFTSRTGASALTARDAAWAARLAGGNRTAHVLGDSRGVALAEIFRVGTTGGGRLVNLSARAYAGTGDDTLIGGFVVADGPVRVLLRGLGPGLAAMGVSGTIGDPELRLYAGSAQLASNDDWEDGDAATVRATGFAPANASRDAALVLTLPPGAYTAHVRDAQARTGLALLEIYLLP